jgi:DNA-binding transcriptional MerR regulator
VTVGTVRFYERVGVLPAPARTASGYREYEPGTIERIRLTRQLQVIGFTLTDAVDALAAHDAGGATCESERWRLDAVLARVDAKLAELGSLRGRIVQARDACADGHCMFTSPAIPGS